MTRSILSRSALLRILADGLLLLGLLWGTAVGFSTAFRLDVDFRLLSLALGAFALLSLAVFSLPLRFGMPLLFLLALGWGRMVWVWWEDLFAGQASITCSVVNAYAGAFPFLSRIVPTMERTAAQWTWAVTLTVLAAGAVLAVLLGFLVVRVRSCWGCILLTALPLVPAFFITMTPGRLPLMVLLAVWGALLLSGLTARRAPGPSAVLTLAALPLLGGLLAVLTLVLPGEEYRIPAWAVRTRETLMQTLGDGLLSLELPGPLSGLGGPFTAAGSAPEVDLSAAGRQSYDGHAVLRIRTGCTGKFYLRGYSAAVYQGGVWGPLEESAYDDVLIDGALPDDAGLSTGSSPLNLPAWAGEELPYYAFEIETLSAPGGCLYVPYQLLTRPGELRGAAVRQDAGIARDPFVRSHTVYYRPGAAEPDGLPALTGTARAAEARYESFVQAHYLQLPEELEAGLEPHARIIASQAREELDHLLGSYVAFESEAQPDGAAFSWTASLSPSPQGLARQTAAYLAELARYELYAPAAPAGEDFVLHFLNESRRGSCMHFASAGALLLRSLGVPARYVSGYMTDVPTSGACDVPDRAAHAWVEIYLSGYGWYPVEMTPGYEGGSRPEAAAPSDPLPSASPTPAPSPETSPRPSRAPGPSVSMPPEAAPHSPGPSLPPWAWAVPALLAALFLPVLTRYCVKVLRRRRFRQEDLRRSMAALYRYGLRLSRHGGTLPPVVDELAQKAVFSRDGVTREERRLARSALSAEAERLDCALPWRQRALLRWFWFLL